MDETIKISIEKLFGQKCCKKIIHSNGNLSLGFGKKIYHNNLKLDCEYFGEWEVGSYYKSWRIIQENIILLGSGDTDSNEEKKEKIDKINFDEILSIHQQTQFDVRVILKHNLIVDFLATFSENDELFHIFCPNNKFIEMDNQGVWKFGDSNKPNSRNKENTVKGK